MQNNLRPAALLRAPIPAGPLAVAAVLGYALTRPSPAATSRTASGLAAVALFVAAIFLGRRAAVLVVLAVAAITVGPLLLTRPWTALDGSIVDRAGRAGRRGDRPAPGLRPDRRP